MRPVLMALAVLGLVARGEAGPCPPRFVVPAGTALLGDPAIVLGDGTVTIGACGPARTRLVRAGRKGWRLAARWPTCAAARRLRLHARLSADCSHLAGVVRGKGVARTPFSASPSVCGDGVTDGGAGESCDDGNTLGGDTCDATCTPCDPSSGPADTWPGIQENLFERYGCINCHGRTAESGGLDLRPAVARAKLIGVTSSADPLLPRVQPGNAHASVLWEKLSKGTFGGFDDLSGSGMPIGGRITPAELDAVAAWIDAGAPADGVVAGTDAVRVRCRPR